MESGWGSRLPRLAKIALVALVALLVAEVVVRARASALPPPLKWAIPDLDRKVQQMGDLADSGGASVVFLGSSTVDGSVDPSAMTLGGRPGYNAAIRGGTVDMVATWAMHTVIDMLDPDIAVVGVASRELNRNDARQAARQRDFYEAPAVRHLLDDETWLQRAGRKAEDVSALFKYRTQIRQTQNLKAFFGSGEAPSITQTAIGDYLATDGQFQLFLRRPYNATTFLIEEPKDPDVDEANIVRLRELLAFLAERVDRVIVVNMPVTADYITSRQDHERFTQTLERESSRAGATYVETGIWPTEYFADPVHVNTEGSQRLTELLEETIEDGG